jgi:cysteinyl-tRNA synthetase
MDDDFNTAAAIGTLFDMLKAINATIRLLAVEQVLPVEILTMIENGIETVKALARILGFRFNEQDQMGAETEQTLVNQLMTLLLELRKEARAQKNWAMADRIRDGIAQLGIQIKDHPSGEST